ncbi:phytanoyl-CoA dioxygenase family protein [Streptacidiphilus sp. EB129]|uniref:phytanoyl-CoA dioxygenase family protein n=1 Tax=Streptacidiphilus sp. EB129 TaxID=3156262 RepID=UPI003515375E
MDGFVRIEGAFSRETAEQCVDRMWPDTGFDRDDPSTWTAPVVRLPGYTDEPFRRAASMPVLHQAFDQLVGPGRWVPSAGLGTVPVRFPHPDPSGDDGWHIEGSYTAEGTDWPYLANHRSRGRALLMLFLFTDVTEADAPTRIRVGSHLAVPSRLLRYGEAGLDIMQIGRTGILEATAHLPVAQATGAAGDVYLCHPFLVHAAQGQSAGAPRFMAQPPLEPAVPLLTERADGDHSPVERAIRAGLGR